jgi:hypothetical protein
VGLPRQQAQGRGILEVEKLLAKVPPHACVTAPMFPACVDCWSPQGSVKEGRRKERETDRREKLRKRFPDGPFVRADLGSGGPSAQHGYFFELPYEYQQLRCEEYELNADPDKVVLSPAVKLPTGDQDSRVEWYATTVDDAIYGFVIARSPEEARRALRAFPMRKGTDLTKLAPEPNVAADFDSCGDCGSCGD